MLSIIKTATKETLFYKLPTLVGDILIQVGVLSFLLYGTGMVREKNLPLYEQTGSWFLLVISCLLTAWLVGVKVNERGRGAVNIANRAILNAAVTFILYNGLMAIIYELVLQGKLLGLQAVLTGALYVIWHLLMRQVIARVRRRGANTYPVVLVGTEPNMLSAFRAMTESDDTGYKVLGFFTTAPGDVPAEVPNLGTPDGALSYIEQNHDSIKEVLCSLNPATETEFVQKLVATCENHMVRFKYVPGMEGYPKRKMTISQLGNVNVISLHDEPLNTPLAKFVKRSADVIFSGLFLVTLFPLVWLICAIGIKLSSPGPVFFKQKRTGYEGKEFWCYKFRSMHQSADADTKQAVKGDSTRRVPAVHQRLQGGHVHHRPPPPYDPPHGHLLRTHRRLHDPPPGETRHHRLGAGERLPRRDEGTLGDERPRGEGHLVHRTLVGGTGCLHLPPDRLADSAAPGRESVLSHAGRT